MKTFLLSFCTTFILLIAGNFIFMEEEVYSYHKVTVTHGDTLWEIAGKYTAEHEDIREVVFRICEENDLADQDIQPGQIIRIPVSAGVETGLMMAAK